MNEAIGYLLKRTQSALHNVMENALRPLALTTSQYATLDALYRAPNASNADLARACFVTPQTMNEILKSLEKAGLITREPHPTNKRIIQTHLTQNGSTLYRTADHVAQKIDSQMRAGLDPEEQALLCSFLKRCFQNMENVDEH